MLYCLSPRETVWKCSPPPKTVRVPPDLRVTSIRAGGVVPKSSARLCASEEYATNRSTSVSDAIRDVPEESAVNLTASTSSSDRLGAFPHDPRTTATTAGTKNDQILTPNLPPPIGRARQEHEPQVAPLSFLQRPSLAGASMYCAVFYSRISSSPAPVRACRRRATSLGTRTVAFPTS